jgi:hypothetical protein
MINKKTDKVTKVMGPLGKPSRKSTKNSTKETGCKKILGLTTTNSKDSEL